MTVTASNLRAGQTYAFPFGSRTFPRTVRSVRPVTKDVAGMRLALVEVTHETPTGEVTSVNFVPSHRLEILSAN